MTDKYFSPIKDEIMRLFTGLGANSDILATVGSWKDALPDKEILEILKQL